MRHAASRGRFVACAAVVGLLVLAAPLGAQTAPPAQPNYLNYLEFATSDSPEIVTLKHAYNDTVAKYNRGLYDYWVTLERINRLVELHDASPDPAVKKKARDEAQPLRTRLAELGREVRSRATAVDQAARRAASGGVSITR